MEVKKEDQVSGLSKGGRWVGEREKKEEEAELTKNLLLCRSM